MATDIMSASKKVYAMHEAKLQQAIDHVVTNRPKAVNREKQRANINAWTREWLHNKKYRNKIIEARRDLSTETE